MQSAQHQGWFVGSTKPHHQRAHEPQSHLIGITEEELEVMALLKFHLAALPDVFERFSF
jgi:hypothetical protein